MLLVRATEECRLIGMATKYGTIQASAKINPALESILKSSRWVLSAENG